MAKDPTDIAYQVREALANDPRLQHSTIDVTYEDGAILLTGTVDRLENMRLAEEIARQQDGVDQVINQIRTP